MGHPGCVEDGAPGFVVALGVCDPTRDDEAVTNGAPGEGREDRVECGREDGLWWGQASRRP